MKNMDRRRSVADYSHSLENVLRRLYGAKEALKACPKGKRKGLLSSDRHCMWWSTCFRKTEIFSEH
ncbi:MAG: hypothetical protein LBO66_14160 [Deltaproteobacteria bacterium]|nr:hypothetical protein [Deltaproteobacteria bacterium]